MFLPVSDTRYRQNHALPLPWCSAVKWAFPALDKVGDTFHFLGIPGSRPKPQYIFLIHNQEITIYRNILHIISSLILNNFTNTSPIGSQYYYSPSHPNLSINNFLTPFQPIPLPYPGYTFPWQKHPKMHHYTLSYMRPWISNFFIKIPKNGLKSLFLNR